MKEKQKYERPEALKSFYSSGAWQKCRETYLASVGGLCEFCLKEGLVVPADSVHHKTPLTVFNVGDPKISLSWSNLCAVCRDHHAQLHRKTQLRYKVMPDGTVITREDEG